MEQFETRNLKVLGNSSDEILDSGSSVFNKVRNATKNLVENISRLDCFIELDQPFSKGTSNTEQTIAKLANAAQKGTYSFNHRDKCFANNINNCKQSLKRILKICRCGFA